MPRRKIPISEIEASRAESAFRQSKADLAEATGPTKGRTRIMYIESKAEDLCGGPARIGRVTFSKSGKTIYYRGRVFHRPPQCGFKFNYYDTHTNEDYWISGPKKNGSDRLYGERVPIEIDEDVREEYWTEIRGLPEMKDRKWA